VDTCSDVVPVEGVAADIAHPKGSLFPEWGRAGSVLTSLVGAIEHLDALLLAIDVAVVFLSVVYRYFLHTPINWVEEVAGALMGMLVFLGSGTVLARDRHSGMDAVRQALPERWQPPLTHLSRWIVVTVAAGIVFASVRMAVVSFGETTPIGLPQWIFVYPPIAGGCFLLVVSLAKALAERNATTFLSLAFLIAVAVAFWASAEYLPDHEFSPAAMIGLSVIVPLLIGVPVAFSLAFGALVYFGANPMLDISIYSQQLISGCGHFVLLAIPFFILAGLGMEANGMSIRLIELLLRMMGRMRGGLNIIIVVASAFFSGISGSKNADIAAVGAVIMPAVRKCRQDPNDAAGLLATTAITCESIPPCINIIIFGFVANVSIGALFVAGLVPAVVLCVAVLVPVVLFGHRVDPDEAFEVRKPLLPMIGGAMVGLVMIVMIGRGVMIGVATSTEISAFAVVYALVVGSIAFRELTIRSTVRLFVNSAGTTSSILFIVAAASALAYALTIEQIPQDLSGGLIEFGTQYGPTLFMIAAAAMMILFGSVLEGAPALIIFGPLLTPVAARLGIDPLHFGIVTVVSMGAGLCAPPLGVALYTTCAVTQTDIKDVSRAMMKYLGVLAIGLLLVILVPGFSVWLPHHWGL
jgi:tripartite ATP-independent transporter DctM subunit